MVVSLRANRKRIIAFLILAAVVIGACIFLRGGGTGGEAEKPQEYPGGTGEQRAAFLAGFGWEVEPNAVETREVMIPAAFDDVYTAYNVMQLSQGFDLRPYAGEVCTQYKYKINNYPNEPEVYATLLVYGELIIGGDVACAELDGFMHGFAPGSAYYGETAGTDGAPSETPGSGTESAPESSPASPEDTDASSAESGVESAAAENVSSGTESTVESTAADVIPEDAYPTD